MKSVLSVDVAKGKSMIMLSTEYGEVLIEPKEIKHNFRDFNELKDKIESFNLEDLTIFMESTGIYHLPVERYFKENNFNTLVINLYFSEIIFALFPLIIYGICTYAGIIYYLYLIIILLILAGISINAILQNGGIIENTQKTSELTQIAAIKEAVNMKLMELQESGSKITTEELENIVKNSNAEVVKNEVGNITDIKIGKKLIKIEEIIPNLDIEKTNESLIGIVKNATKSEIRNISVKSEKYSANILVYKGDLILDGIKQVDGAELKQNKYEFGNKETDIGTESEDAKNMVILKIDGDLTVNSGITLTACKSDNGYGGPKGMMIYCTGTLTNNGTISMTARGAKASGQNVYLWQNLNGEYEYIPAVRSK